MALTESFKNRLKKLAGILTETDMTSSQFQPLQAQTHVNKAFLYIFNNGNFLKWVVEKLPNGYIKLPSGQEVPIEDVGDYLLSNNDMTEDEAFKVYLSQSS